MDAVLRSNLAESNVLFIEEKRVKLHDVHNVKDVNDFSAVEVEEIYEEIASGLVLILAGAVFYSTITFAIFTSV